MIWSIQHNAITWSFHQGKLFTASAKSGDGHRKLHNHNGLPLHGAAFDLVERGRAALYKPRKTHTKDTSQEKLKLVIEVVSLGAHEHLSDRAYKAILKHYALDESKVEIAIHEPQWDNEPVLGLLSDAS